jgi:vacuolar protein sorting-associated protein 11
VKRHLFYAIITLVSVSFRYILVGSMDEKTKRAMITIYDLRNKFIVMSHLLPLGDHVRMVLQDGGVAYIITSSWSIIRFREKDTASKLDVLLRKSLYPLAITLAAEEQTDVSEVMRLYKLFADHLYKKSDFEAAVQQYCHTIGFVQPSYVIRRFLDTQRISNLTLYLEKLHSRGLATKDHTTLLLTCYTKTNNTQKLYDFCQVPSGVAPLSQTALSNSKPAGDAGVGDGVTLNFDVLTAIYTLHDAGFDEHALRLALLNGKHEEYIHINLVSKTLKDVDKALSYFLAMLSTAQNPLPMADIAYLVLKFGSALLAERPLAFTTLLVQLCTGSLDKKKIRQLLASESGEEESPDPEQDAPNKGKRAVNQELLPVEDALSVFADDEPHLRMFIEGVSDGMRAINMTLPARLTELLLELYLSEYQTSRNALMELTRTMSSSNGAVIELSSKLKGIEERVMAILDGASSANSDYDLSSALLLMHAFGFEPGEMFIYEKMQSTDLILRKCIETGNERGIMRVLKREGRKDSELFIQVLTYFIRLTMSNNRASGDRPGGDEEPDGGEDEDEDEDERWDLISEVLTLVEKEGVLTPMQILPILSENPNLPLRIASRFIKRCLKQTTDELSTLEQDVSHMKHLVQGVIQEGIAARQHQLNQQSTARTDVSAPEVKEEKMDSSRLKNSSFAGSVNLPGKGANNIQGMGGLRDFEDYEEEDEFEAQQAEAEREAEKRKWLNIKKAQMERTGDHESFFAELEHSNDGFSTIAEYFGKTIIS